MFHRAVLSIDGRYWEFGRSDLRCPEVSLAELTWIEGEVVDEALPGDESDLLDDG